METRLKFKEFKQNFSNGTLLMENLHSYVEIDDDLAIPKLKFRDDALVDQSPEDFDLDDYIHASIQEIDENRYEAEAESNKGKKKVVAEGDSWMNLPLFLNWHSIGDALKLRKHYRVRNIGKWGHTIEYMVRKKQYLDTIEKKNPEFFVFSGGGNDLQDKLKTGGIIKQYDPDLEPNQYLTQDGKDALTEITEHYKTLLRDISTEFPDVKIFTHGYDYPRPLLKGGKYLGTPLRKRGFPDHKMSPVLNFVIETLDSAIKRVTDDYSSTTHVNCLGETESYMWRNDFHPKNEGFNQLAILFENAMG